MSKFPIFISYSRRDIILIKQVRSEVESAIGVRCWMDLQAIESGAKRFTRDIIDGINNCDVLLFMLTEHSQCSEFALRELDFADKKGKHVVIINVNDCAMTDEFQFLYGLTDTIRWNDVPQREKLFRDLMRWVSNVDSHPKKGRKGKDGMGKSAITLRPRKKVIPWIICGVAAIAIFLVLLLFWGNENKMPDIRGLVKSSNSGDLELVVDGVSYVMKPVEGGTFLMGSDDSEAANYERPVHSVTVSSFYIGATEVTQALWKAVMTSNPSTWNGDELPVQCVCWNDCQEFLRIINSVTGKDFRLPNEAEWEFAARGGMNSRCYQFAGSNSIDSVSWYDVNSGGKPHVVGTKLSNELGLYDMSGNVMEWCQDWRDKYNGIYQTNPQGPLEGMFRVLRGGSWFDSETLCRVSSRYSRNPEAKSYSYGFRLVLSQ